MLETGRLARRTAALSGMAAGPVQPLPAASRFSLRLREAEAGQVGTVAGLRIDLGVNRCAAGPNERLAARLGPDEWLLTGPEQDTDVIAAEVAAALAGRFHALVDVSHRSVALAVTGARAADILNAGCPLDLHPSRFPPGAATRTILGKAEIVLLRPGEEPVYRVECWRSFAAYVQAFLRQAAEDV